MEISATWQIRLINNWQAREVRTGAEAREGLYHQVPNPVRWTESMRLLISKGVTATIPNAAPAACYAAWCGISIPRSQC